MKVSYGLGLASLTFALFGCGVWVGCSTSSGGAPGGSDAGGEAAADAGGGDAGGDSGGERVSCASYCAKVAAMCTGANAQYKDEADCLKECAFMDLGVFAQAGNVVGCRQYHAGNTPAEEHCPHAGPYGGAQCGGLCEDLCQLAFRLCTPDAGAAPPFASEQDCNTACAAWPVLAGQPTGFNGPQTGDSFNCRSYHLNAAFTANAALHCSHIAPDGGPCR